MSIYLEKEYVNRIRPKLTGFTQKSDFLWNFRCPVCGDSKKNKSKMRGYIYRRKNDLFFSCHNCNINWSFTRLLQYLDQPTYSEYLIDTLRGTKPKTTEIVYKSEKPVFKTKINLPTILDMPESHMAYQYIKHRQLPEKFWSEIYYAEDFKEFILDLIPNYDKNLMEKEKRIVIPFYDEKKNLLGVQGRALSRSEIKYISVKLNPDNPKLYGLDRVDPTKRILILEGPFDSMFLDNAIGKMDANLEQAIHHFGSDKDYTLVYDNQPRNPDIIKTMRRAIDHYHNVVIWPKTIIQKDINDMILDGMTASEIMHIIDTNTYTGLRAKLEFDIWRKC